MRKSGPSFHGLPTTVSALASTSIPIYHLIFDFYPRYQRSHHLLMQPNPSYSSTFSLSSPYYNVYDGRAETATVETKWLKTGIVEIMFPSDSPGTELSWTEFQSLTPSATATLRFHGLQPASKVCISHDPPFFSLSQVIQFLEQISSSTHNGSLFRSPRSHWRVCNA